MSRRHCELVGAKEMITAASVVLSLAAVAAGIRCRQCEGLNCASETDCTAEFCFAAEFRPKIVGLTGFSSKSDWFQKGCGWGRVPPEAMDTCETSGVEPDGLVVRSCLCRQDYCNSDVTKLRKSLPTTKVPLVECVCENFDYCKEGRCKADLCTYVVGTGKESRGCLNSTAPLLERHLRDVCVTPGFVGGRHHSRNDLNEALDYQMCSCAGHLCNSELPRMAQGPLVECPMSLEVVVPGMGSFDTEAHRTCRGHRCFSANFTTELLGGSATGCLDFAFGVEPPESGCFSTEAGRTTTEFCLGRKMVSGQIVDEPKVDTVTEAPTESTTTEPAEIRKVNKVQRDNGVSKPTSEPLRHRVIIAAISNAEQRGVEDDRDVSANNTAIVAVFVVLIIIILLVGVGWKFDLHKRIFAARYQTVSG